MERLLWLDMEMTGLDVRKEVVIEVACVITDLEFNSLYEYHSVVRQPQTYIDGMDKWNREHHGASGLIAQIPGGRDPHAVEGDLLQICDQYFAAEKPILAGNSIGQDRLFIEAQFPTFAARLHYRMLDVTSWKVLMSEKYKIAYKKKNSHRAVDDIYESIAELKTYLQYVRV